MIRGIPLVLLVLSACSAQQEPVLEEPVIDIAQEDLAACSPDDEDGIGGTGCEPVARQALGQFFSD
ncbi:MAG: hypothetical protein AAGF55_12385 [Pseudomonadota bacterium]